jgi:hypothetical protein
MVSAGVDRIGSPAVSWTRGWLVEKTCLVGTAVVGDMESYHHPRYRLPFAGYTCPATALEDFRRTVAQVLEMSVAAEAFVPVLMVVVVGLVISKYLHTKEQPMVSLHHCPS